MKTRRAASATKQDIALLRKQMATKAGVDRALRQLSDDLSKKFDAAVETMKLYFDAANERFSGDIAAINMEKIKDHETRIIHLEVITRVR